MLRFLRRATLDELAARGDSRRLLKAVAPRDTDFVLTGEEYLDVEWRRRQEAATHLGTVPGDEVTDALVARLDDFTPGVRLSALRGLVSRSDAREGDMVRAVLSWPEDGARQQGGELLVARADADDAAATRIVLAYVDDGGPAEHSLEDEWARVVFGAIDEPGRSAAMKRAVQRWLETPGGLPRAHQVARADQDLGVEVLLARLETDPRRSEVARLLGELRDARATEPLAALLRAASAREREAAARALGQIQDPRSVAELLRVAADPVFAVRDAAQRALDALGTAGVVWSVAAAARGALDGAGPMLAAVEAQKLLAEPDQASA